MKPVFRGLALTALFSLGLAVVPTVGQQPKPLPLSHEQQLQIENDAKDVKLAQQQIELLKVQLAGALIGEQRSAQVFNNYLAQLRTQLNVPASSWDFDASTLSFVPKGYKPPVAAAKPAATGTAATPKPASKTAAPVKKPGGGI